MRGFSQRHLASAPWMCRRGRRLSLSGRPSHPALLSLRPDQDHSSVLGLCPQRALLDERKFRVFFPFLRFLSFPQTKALTVLLASPEEFTEEAGGVSSGGAGGSGRLPERGPPCSRRWALVPGKIDRQSCAEGQAAAAVEAGLDAEPGGRGRWAGAGLALASEAPV